jgi:serine/threonine protein kinase
MKGFDRQISREKWARIREIHAKIMDAPEQDRGVLANQLCEDDAEIEFEVRSLLLAHNSAGSFLEESACAALNLVHPENTRSEFSVGTVLAGRFSILRLLKTGGMGTVYEAWDSDLRQNLALKTIRPEIASHQFIIERFKAEVRQARQVTHPNICRVYDLFTHEFDSGDRVWFFTMEFLEGATLLDHIRQKGGLTCRESLPLVEQMIAGMAAAHQHGIIHRDFKSSNVMLINETDGSLRAMILDFGLAGQISANTNTGRQGTPGYVAPEQWFDGVVSEASDQYSLGVVMYEMLTGDRPASAVRDRGSTLRPLHPTGKRISARWKSAIRRCLEVNPERRFISLDDLLASLDPNRSRRLVIRWILASATVLLLLVASALIEKGMKQLPVLTDLKLLTPERDFSEAPRFSGDAKKIAYVSDRAEPGNMDVWVQRLPDGVPERITTDRAKDDFPSLSPDGHLVAFESTRLRSGIYLAEPEKSGDELVVPGGHEPAFSPDGHSILYWTGDEYGLQPNGGLFVKDLDTGKTIQLAAEMRDARTGVWNSDGRHILFYGCADLNRPLPECRDWWVTTRDGAAPRRTNAIGSLFAQSIKPTPYFGGWQRNTVVFSGVRNGLIGLWEINLDPGTATISGRAKQLMSGDKRDFIIASSLVGDSLAFCKWNPAIHVWRIETAGDLKRVTPSRVTNDTEFDYAPSVSRNGRWLTFARGYSNDRKIYLKDTDSGMEIPMPFKEPSKYSPIVDDNGQVFAFESSEHETPSIWIGNREGKEWKLCSDCRSPSGWLTDPDAILYSNSNFSEVLAQPVAGGETKTVLKSYGGTLRGAVWSPKNGFILFNRARTGGNGQIFVAQLPLGAKSPASKWMEITEESYSSRNPGWSVDGRTVFYLSNQDGYWCLWGRHFNSRIGQAVGAPFPVQHFHDPKFSPTAIDPSSFNLSVAGTSLYFNVLEVSGTIWVGRLERNPVLSLFR